jgi:23S rRNA (uracil1939-C5)-methyltransferase
VQQAIKGMPTQFYEMHLFGKDHIVEFLTIRNTTFRFKISLSSFFQPNSMQAACLYERALSMTPHPKKCVLDLYAGTATFGIVFASIAERVIAIELAKEAILDAAVNCEWNGIHNVILHAGDAGAKLKELKNLSDWIDPDLVIVDPPRAGLGAEVIRILCELKPQEILYISCNPTSQALDAQSLQQGGYKIVQVQPVDQFPHTPHIENILLLKR